MKRDLLFGAGSFLVAFVTMILLTVSQTIAQDGTLHETFDDLSLVSWHNSPGVIVMDGALHLPPANAATPPGSWDAMTLTIRLQRSGNTGLAISYHASENGTYVLGIDPAQIMLGREEAGAGTALGHSETVTIPENTWFEVTITFGENTHQIALNGETILTVDEPNPLPAGGVSFETMHETTAIIDEITISTGDFTAPPPSEPIAAASVDLSACEANDGFHLCPDLPYANYDQAGMLLLDLYLPDGATSPPVLVYIHGGGWFENTKAGCPGATFAQDGYATACIDYRLATGTCEPDTVFPAQIHDAKAAVRWLRQNAAIYGYDADHIGAIGESSGGHLAALLGVSTGVSNLEGAANHGPSSAVQAVVDWYGPVDITQGPMVFEDDPCLTDFGALSAIYGGEEVPYFYWTYAWGVFLGGGLTDAATVEQARAATPLSYVDADDPPFLIMHGETDGMVPITQSELLANALQAEGVDVTFIRMPNAGHGYWSDTDPIMPDFLIPTLQFFDQHLKNQ
jgi:acetyl esterase/lipase